MISHVSPEIRGHGILGWWNMEASGHGALGGLNPQFGNHCARVLVCFRRAVQASLWDWLLMAAAMFPVSTSGMAGLRGGACLCTAYIHHPLLPLLAQAHVHPSSQGGALPFRIDTWNVKSQTPAWIPNPLSRIHVQKHAVNCYLVHHLYCYIFYLQQHLDPKFLWLVWSTLQDKKFPTLPPSPFTHTRLISMQRTQRKPSSGQRAGLRPDPRWRQHWWVCGSHHQWQKMKLAGLERCKHTRARN